MTRTSHVTLGDLVAANPAAARVLDGFGLDYCCHGDRTVSDACTTAGIDHAVVLDALLDLEVEGDTTWTTLAAPALAAHIVETHHRYLHEELPLLDALADKVLSVHRGRHPELRQVRRLVGAIRSELEPHLVKEEVVLFPAIGSLAAGERDVELTAVAADTVRALIMEHDQAGELLADLRAASVGYGVPDDACASYRSLYERLAALELDTHLHIHKENHALFPTALRLTERS